MLSAYLINLDRDADRLAHMAQEFLTIGLTFERIPAVYGLAMPDWVKPYFLNAEGEIASRLKAGEVGCYASHLVTARRLLDDGKPYALVCEDDLRLDADLTAVLQAVLAVLPHDWDVVRLSNPPKSPYLALADLPGGRDLVIYSRVPNNTGAFLLSASGAQKLLHPGLRSLQIDEHLRRPWLLNMETFGVVAPPILSNIFDSTIDLIDDRKLGKETILTKLKRRHFGGFSEVLRSIVWKLNRIGFLKYFSMVIKRLLDKKNLRYK